MKTRPQEPGGQSRRIYWRSVITAIVTCFVVASQARGYGYLTYPSYDLDSLAYLAEHIIQARVLDPDSHYPLGVVVTRVYSGSFAIGQTIRPYGLYGDLKPGTGTSGQNRPLAPGDQVVLFLTATPQKLECVHEGMFLIVRGRLCPFGIQPPNGAMGWQPPRLDRASPTEREFASGIAARLPLVAQWRALIDAPLDQKNISALLSLLRQRAKPSSMFYWDNNWDAVSDAAAKRLAESGDPRVADQAITASERSLSWFGQLFQTLQGRDFLLKQIADPAIPANHRVALASMLGARGAVYTFSYPVAATQPWPPGTVSDRKNSSYLTRIADVAARTAAENEHVSALVLDALRQLTSRGWSSIPRDPEIQSDLDSAADVLGEFYHRPSTTDPLRYRIEKVMAGMSYAAYLSLHSKCGPILTLAKPLDWTQYAAPAIPSIMLGYEFECALPYVNGRMPTFPPITATDLVLDPVGGGPGYAFPSGMIASRYPGSGGGGGDNTALPANFKPGRYRLHYLITSGNKVLSDGHGFETWVPQPELARLPQFVPWTTPRRTAPWRQSWTIAAIALGTLLFILLFARRILRSRTRIRWFRNGQCHVCGYDLRASGGRCSECGTLVPSLLRTQILCRRLIRIVALSCLVLAVAMFGLCARSFLVGDVITRTAFDRSDASYLTRGSAVFQWFTIGSDLGWTYDRQAPSDLPQAASDAGPDADWSILGLEYASRGNMLVMPLWMPIVFSVAAGMVLLRIRKYATVTRPCVQSA